MKAPLIAPAAGALAEGRFRAVASFSIPSGLVSRDASADVGFVNGVAFEGGLDCLVEASGYGRSPQAAGGGPS